MISPFMTTSSTPEREISLSSIRSRLCLCHSMRLFLMASLNASISISAIFCHAGHFNHRPPIANSWINLNSIHSNHGKYLPTNFFYRTCSRYLYQLRRHTDCTDYILPLAFSLQLPCLNICLFQFFICVRLCVSVANHKAHPISSQPLYRPI